MVLGGLSCSACQLLPERYSRSVFKHAHGFRDDWEPPFESDEERYQIPEACLNRILIEYLDLTINTRHLAQECFNVMSRRDQRILERNLELIVEYQSRIRLTEERQRGRPIDDGTESSHTTLPVRVCVNNSEEIIATIQVCRAEFVQIGRWYLGHRPGTYIFKYRGSQTAVYDSDTFMDARCYTLNIFEYAGQIPRSEKLHKQRLGMLFGKVLRLFISELQVFAGLQHGEMYPELERMLGLERVRSATWFREVWNCWRNANAYAIEWPDAEIRNCFVSNPSILELAWILDYLKRRRSGEDQPLEPLELLVISATQEQLPELATRWEAREQEVAWDMLESGRRTGLFVYEVTPETEDIHNFYRQAQFSDLLNPAVVHSFKPLWSYRVSAADYQVGLSEDTEEAQS
ncbi:hypothetical protein FPOAC2_06633 [Fusarium poae]|uniref:hypothetical protein n=1 Tax=Fusarium poae TaxID=36050 RepID=UPI001CE87BE8|nr:hypothetical protein FPOAC1_006506 [Fusarium poae]KAG8673199.1 hypothetical protein FPOAC1_006506 [Fusarium poae]